MFEVFVWDPVASGWRFYTEVRSSEMAYTAALCVEPLSVKVTAPDGTNYYGGDPSAYPDDHGPWFNSIHLLLSNGGF